MSQAAALRFRIFIKELRWLDASGRPGHELDLYDKKATHIAILDETGKIIAYVRMWRRETQGFMLEKEFRALRQKPELLADIQTEIAELSRLAIEPAFQGSMVFFELYYAMYRWSCQNRVRYWICVVNRIFLRSLYSVFKLHYTVIGKRDETTAVLIPIRQFRWWAVLMRIWHRFRAIASFLHLPTKSIARLIFRGHFRERSVE